MCTERFDRMAAGLLEHQAPDGAFHTNFTKADGHIEPTDLYRNGGFLFGNAMGLKGLIWTYRITEDSKYLEAAKKGGDYYINHYFDPEQVATGGSFGWLAAECLSELYRLTGGRQYADFAQKIAHSIPLDNLEGMQPHTYLLHNHSYLLSLRGLVQVHEIQNDPELLNAAIQQHRLFRDRIMWPGGGIIEHLGSRADYEVNYWFDEGCAVDDWLGLNLDLWRVTLDTAYMDMVERTHLNHFYYGQDQSGGFCGDRSVDSTREGSPWPYCCAMRGTRTLSELTQYIATTDGKEVYVNVFLPATTELVVKGRKVSVDLATDYPKSGSLHITVDLDGKLTCALKVRVPGWSRVNKVLVNGEPFTMTLAGGYLSIERDWRSGDTAEVELDMPLRTECRNQFIGNDDSTDYSTVSIWEGPRQLVYNQSLNNHLWDAVSARPALRSAYQTYGKLEKDQSVRQTPLNIGGRNYKKGLGTHSVSEIEFYLGGQFKEFVSDIGIDACTGGKGKVRFKVCVDGMVERDHTAKPEAAAPGDGGWVDSIFGSFDVAMDGNAPAQTIRVNVSGAKTLRLVVDDGIGGLADDCADWGDARLVKMDGTVVHLSDLPDDTALGMPWDWGVVELMAKAEGAAPQSNVVTLQYRIGDQLYPMAFNYLADLGYTLIEKRPVLQSYLKANTDWLNAR